MKVEISKEEAKVLYPTASPKLKKQLDEILVEKKKPTLKITDKIKTFEDACDHLQEVAITFPQGIPKAVIAFYKLSIIIKALNQGWEPNWKDNREYKYYPWFEQSPSGFGFSAAGYDFWGARTHVGSRLCLKTEKLTLYAGKQFESLYNDFLSLD